MVMMCTIALLLVMAVPSISSSQGSGCPGDEDCDGALDAQDACPGYDNNLDTDGDGITDCQDNCPWKANPNQLDSNGDGFGDECPEDLKEKDSGEIQPTTTMTKEEIEDLYGDQTVFQKAGSEGAAGGCGKITIMGIDSGQQATTGADYSGMQTTGVSPSGTGATSSTGTAGATTATSKMGCPGDEDCDGVPDAQDACLGYDNNLDTDGDGIPDCNDNCPWKSNPSQADGNADGFGDECPEDLQ